MWRKRRVHSCSLWREYPILFLTLKFLEVRNFTKLLGDGSINRLHKQIILENVKAKLSTGQIFVIYCKFLRLLFTFRQAKTQFTDWESKAKRG